MKPYRAPVNEKSSIEDAKSKSSANCKDAVDSLGQLATDSGDWNVCYLFLHDMECAAKNRSACPETVKAIKYFMTSLLLLCVRTYYSLSFVIVYRNIPHQYNHALFSALAPETHVTEHYGPTNKKLRCHLPLVVPRRTVENSESSPPLCSITVANEERRLQAGKCVIFDDSFLHEAVNRARPFDKVDPATGPRVVLIVDIWHPDLSAEEVRNE